MHKIHGGRFCLFITIYIIDLLQRNPFMLVQIFQNIKKYLIW